TIDAAPASQPIPWPPPEEMQETGNAGAAESATTDEPRVPPLPPPRVPHTAIARLFPESFIDLSVYMNSLGEHPLDLAIVLDCTASMWGELSDAQGGIDDLMLFAGSVTRGMRVAIVAYRDRKDRDFETRGWDFTASVD